MSRGENIIWDDTADPRHRLARFIGSEIYLSLSAADELLAALHDAKLGGEQWQWHGNSHSLVLRGDRCAIIDHYADLESGQIPEVEMDASEVSEAITRWKEFVLRLGIRHF
jgi:hypothetical protein